MRGIPNVLPAFFGRSSQFFGRANTGSAAASASFSATLLSTLVPEVYTGSSTPTFTRATTAYVTDFEGLLKQTISGESRFSGARRVRNIVPNSEVSTGWLLNTITATAGQTDPLGGTTAFRLTATAASNNVMYATVSAPSGATTGSVTWSIWAKRVTGSGTVRLAMNSGAQGNATLSLTTSWQRFSVSNAAAISGGSVQLNVYVDTNADAIDVAFMLAEETTGQSNTNPSEYVSKGVLSAPYHGAGVDGVKYFTTQNGNTVASNVVTEATGAAISSATLLGYQAEGARTNLCLQSQTFDNASWTATDVVVAANQYVAPDGTTTMDKITASATSAYHYVLQTCGGAAGVTTESFYVKYVNHQWVQVRLFDGSAIFIASFDLLNGVVGLNSGGGTASIAQISSGVYRISVTYTTVFGGAQILLNLSNANSASLVSWAAAGTEAVGVWGAQTEVASFASSYIPTTTVAVTRNSDSLSYSAASNIDSTVGSAVLGYTPSVALPGIVSLLSSASTNNSVLTQRGNAVSTYLQTYDATNNPLWTVSAFAAATACKVGTAWGGVTQQSYKDGALGTGAATTFDGNFNLGANFGVGAENNIVQPFGCIRNLAIYAAKKTDAEMQALTA